MKSQKKPPRPATPGCDDGRPEMLILEGKHEQRGKQVGAQTTLATTTAKPSLLLLKHHHNALHDEITNKRPWFLLFPSSETCRGEDNKVLWICFMASDPPTCFILPREAFVHQTGCGWRKGKKKEVERGKEGEGGRPSPGEERGGCGFSPLPLS